MKPSEFIELYCTLQGTSPRPQPWQTELVDRLWAGRLERKRKGSKGKPLPMLAFSSTNWGLGENWLYQLWRDYQASPFRTFVCGADHADKPDKLKVLAMKPRAKGPTTFMFYDEVAYLPTKHPSAETLRNLELVHAIFADGAFDFRNEEYVSDHEAALRLAAHSITATNCTSEPEPQKKKPREPFYRKFQPKRRLT